MLKRRLAQILSRPGTAKLRADNAALRSEVDRLAAETGRLQSLLGAAGQWGAPSFDSDYMRLWFRNVDFMSDPQFLAAYKAGIGSNHGLGAPSADGDLHIEWRILVCCWAAWHAARLPGAFVECGTNTGIMSLAICKYLDWNTRDKRFFLFDTFEGIPSDQIGSGEDHAVTQNTKYRDCYQIARDNFAIYDRVQLVRGKVPDTLGTVEIDRVGYLMIDMNIVYPEKEALTYFWDKMVPGGIMLFDDYGWSGYHLQKEAHDTFAAERDYKILHLPTGQGLLIK